MKEVFSRLKFIEVICVNNKTRNKNDIPITINKTYKVLEVDRYDNITYYVIVNDYDNKGKYESIHFKTFSEFREDQINKILC